MALPLQEQKKALQAELQRIEAENAEFYQTSQLTFKENQKYINELKQEKVMMQKKLADVQARVAHNRSVKKSTFSNMTVKEKEKEERQVMSMKTRLNVQKHTNRTLKQRLDELKREYEKLSKQRNREALRKEEDAMKIRSLENKVEKTQFKYKEAQKLGIHYQKLHDLLLDESQTYDSQLDKLKTEIQKGKEKLDKLHVKENQAQLSKKAAEDKLQRQEQLLFKELKERESVIDSCKKKVAESKARADKNDNRAQRAPMQQDELSSETQRSTTDTAAEEEKAISIYEDAFKRLKEVTMATDMQGILECFISQKETYQSLEKRKQENEEIMVQLREKKVVLSQQLEEMKYSREAKRSSESQILEECKRQLEAQLERCNTVKERRDWLMKTLSSVRDGVESLAEKLKHIGESEDTGTDPGSDEFVVVLIRQCDMKLQLLNKEFEGKDLDALMNEMKENKFYDMTEGKLPEDGQVKISEDQTLYNDEEETKEEEEEEEEEVHVISRETLKQRSQLNNLNSKKNPRIKKNDQF